MYQDFFDYRKSTFIYNNTSLIDENAKKYNTKWRINNLDEFQNWVKSL